MKTNIEEHVNWFLQNEESYFDGFGYAPNYYKNIEIPKRFSFETIKTKTNHFSSLASLGSLNCIDLEVYSKENSPFRSTSNPKTGANIEANIEHENCDIDDELLNLDIEGILLHYFII
jgi:hypothetical protein